MRTLSRAAVVLVFAATLLSALPAHAASRHRAPAPSTAASTASRLSTAWTDAWTGLTRFFASVVGQPAQGKGLSTDGGSCVDPNGCSQAQLVHS